ncbi:MAG: L-threonylcarbamoyladenylate synthase [Sphaerochaetaceae bacterium]|jgi:L-threonylcarbamoyladenylate synthase
MNSSTEFIERHDASAVATAIKVLKRGDIVVLPCDTIYGLSGLLEISETKLRNIKRRPETKPFILLATFGMAREICQGRLPDGLEETWPAPLTAILPDKKGGTTAVRVPQDEFLQAILEGCGTPIYSTSVNTSGEPPLLTFDAIANEFTGKVELLVRGDTQQGTMPSTLIDCTKRPYVVLRQGAFDASELIARSLE